MAVRPGLVAFRLLPVLFVTLAGMFYVAYVEGPDAYAIRNVIPMLVVIILSAVTLYRGGGSWTGAGWRWPLATAGFAIPALGLSLYLHYGFAVDLEEGPVRRCHLSVGIISIPAGLHPGRRGIRLRNRLDRRAKCLA
jgi:hypothetical protein